MSLQVQVYIVFSVNDILIQGFIELFHFGVVYHILVLHVIVDDTTLQLVALFHIVHQVLVAHILDTHTHDLNVAVTVLYVIALYVASAVNVIVHHTATVHVVALASVLHHLFVNPSLIILGAVTVQLGVLLLQLYVYHVQLKLVLHMLDAPFLLNVAVYFTALWVIA